MNWKFWQWGKVQPGDLVVVATDCCGHYLGRIFTVGPIKTANTLRCNLCGRHWFRETICELTPSCGDLAHPALYWLKKIKPLDKEQPEFYSERKKEPKRVPA